MARILIIYSTTDGHTREICQRLSKVIEAQDNQNEVKLISINHGQDIEVDNFDKIVVGASIRYGKHRPQVHEFVNKYEKILDSKPNAFFSVNVVARKPEKNQPDTNPYLLKFLKQVSWRPKELAVFAGKIDYPSYTFWDRLMIRLIMWITKGPTDPKTIIELTDWNKVEAFGKVISNM
ncbi:MAG: menaquinone-dependent protoporphyrinogen IX dehydrogenase [Ignavibacteriaceae bacterium]